MYCITTRQSRRQLLSDFYCYKLQLQQSTYKGHASLRQSSAPVSLPPFLLPPLKLPPPRRRGTTSDDCIASYGSRSALSTGAVANRADQSDPRKLLTSVDTLLGRGRLPANSAIDVASVGRGRQLANSQRTFKAIQGPGHTVGGAFLRNPGHWNFTQA